MREMTPAEYFRWKLREEVRRDAEREGIKIVTERSRPRLVEDDNVVSFGPAKGGEGLSC
jgi:hypothetical protein